MNINVKNPRVINKCPCCNMKYKREDYEFYISGIVTRFEYLCPECGCEVVVEFTHGIDSNRLTYDFLVYKD